MARKNKRKVKTKNMVYVAIITLAIATILILSPKTLDKYTIPATFSLSEIPGMGHIEGQLLFGHIQENQSATRSINILNNYEKKAFVKIKSSGDIKNNLIVSENNFYLEPQESKNVTFTAYTSGLTEYKEYQGEITVLLIEK